MQYAGFKFLVTKLCGDVGTDLKPLNNENSVRREWWQ